MNSHFIQYRCFNDPALAKELIAILEANSIPFQQEDSTSTFDLTFSNNALTQEYIIKLKSADFDKANEVLKLLAEKELHEIDKDHYLFSFTDNELIDIVKKPDEWNSLDYQLAHKLLKDKGIDVNPEKMKQERIEELSKPDVSQKSWIIIGYVFLLIVPIISLLIGYFLNQKKTLPNGEKVFTYSDCDRKHGRILLITGVTAVIIAVLYRVYIGIYP